MTAPGDSPDRSALARLRVGVAGWSYPDWKGTFYPGSLPRGETPLRFAARHFDCLEINSTFYRPPEVRIAAKWAEQVADRPGFTFTAKLHRELTHGHPAPEEITTLCRTFREGLGPLVEADRLGAVLIQFPWHFADSPRARERLERLAGALAPLPLAVELRHVSFVRTDAAGALPFLGRLGLNFVNIDLPRSRTSPPRTCVNTGPIGYYRLHGRNHATWFDPDAGRDATYDYLYRQEELEELLPWLERLARRTEEMYVIANNHYRAQAPANALMLMRLAGRGSVPVPPALAREYPLAAGEPPADGRGEGHEGEGEGEGEGET